LESLDMRKDVQQIFRATPHEKQVMMFSATLSNEIRPVCKKFMHHVESSFRNHLNWLSFGHQLTPLPSAFGNLC